MKDVNRNTPVEELKRSAIEATPRSTATFSYYWYFTTPPAELAGRFHVVTM